MHQERSRTQTRGPIPVSQDRFVTRGLPHDTTRMSQESDFLVHSPTGERIDGRADGLTERLTHSQQHQRLSRGDKRSTQVFKQNETVCPLYDHVKPSLSTKMNRDYSQSLFNSHLHLSSPFTMMVNHDRPTSHYYIIPSRPCLAYYISPWCLQSVPRPMRPL